MRSTHWVNQFFNCIKKGPYDYEEHKWGVFIHAHGGVDRSHYSNIYSGHSIQATLARMEIRLINLENDPQQNNYRDDRQEIGTGSYWLNSQIQEQVTQMIFIRDYRII